MQIRAIVGHGIFVLYILYNNFLLLSVSVNGFCKVTGGCNKGWWLHILLNLPTITENKYFLTTTHNITGFRLKVNVCSGHTDPDVSLAISQSPIFAPIWWISDAQNAVLINYRLDIKATDRRQRLTHWGRVTHIYVSKLTIIGSDNGLSPDRRQAIIWTNAGLLLIGSFGTNFSEILIEIRAFPFGKMRFKVSSAKRRPFCLGLNVLTTYDTLGWSFYQSSAYHPRIYYADHVTADGMFCVKSI